MVDPWTGSVNVATIFDEHGRAAWRSFAAADAGTQNKAQPKGRDAMDARKAGSGILALARVVAASAGLHGAVAQAETELNLSYFVGAPHPMNAAVVQPFKEAVESACPDLKITPHFGGSLVKGGPPQYGALVQGVSDIAYGLPGYTGQVFPFSTAITVPGVTEDGIDATHKLWAAIDMVSTEYNAKVLALWSTDPKVLLTKKKIGSLDDLKGLKIRVTSPQDEPYLNALGAVAVSQPVPVVHQNFTNDVIDGVHIGASGIGSFKLHEPANYVVTNLPVSSSGMFLLMNKSVYDGLSDAHKTCIDNASGLELSLRGAEKYDALYDSAIKLAIDNGVEEIKLSDEQRAEWQAAMQSVVDEFLTNPIDTSQSISKHEVTGQQLVDAYNGKGQ